MYACINAYAVLCMCMRVYHVLCLVPWQTSVTLRSGLVCVYVYVSDVYLSDVYVCACSCVFVCSCVRVFMCVYMCVDLCKCVDIFVSLSCVQIAEPDHLDAAVTWCR